MAPNTDQKQEMTENLKQIKAEGGRRSQKIGKIFRAAFSEAATELKEGTTTIRPLATELAGQTAHVVKEKGQEVNVNVRKALKDNAIDEQDVVKRLMLQVQVILKAVRETLFGHSVADQSPEPLQLQKESSEVKADIVTMDVVAEA